MAGKPKTDKVGILIILSRGVSGTRVDWLGPRRRVKVAVLDWDEVKRLPDWAVMMLEPEQRAHYGQCLREARERDR